MLCFNKSNNSSHKGVLPPVEWGVGFHVEQRRAWWGIMKLIVLNTSAGKVTDGASSGSSIHTVLP